MNTLMKTAMASALALATAAPAAAQNQNYPYGPPYRPTDQYEQQQRDYDNQRAQYEAQRQDYRNDRADYRAARADYERRRADWEARRADYDARYGYGAYARTYGPAPAWDETRWSNAAPAAGYYGGDASYNAPVRCNNNAAVTAGIIGALAGGVLGSNVSHGGGRTGGTVLGALAGGGIGAAVGHAHDKQKCDERGAYYTYNDTVPYRVSNDVYRDDRARYYQRRGCRLAPAAVNDSEYRYVRVCPDSDGRYRVTG